MTTDQAAIDALAEAPFPPETWRDIARYSDAELFEGFSSYQPDDPEPGPNRSPAYRWGWTNAKRDRSREPDGFEGLRAEFIRETRSRGFDIVRKE